jgi:D-amino-acid oxidase
MTAVDAVVVGAGVVGLTTAISLAEAGLATRVVTAEPSPRTTSVAAGAIWGPVLCGPDDRCYEWSRVGLSVLSALAADPSAGVHQVSGREVSETPASPPRWTDLLPGLRILGSDELPAGFTSGWFYTAPAVIMPVYLDYLLNRYAELGGTVAIETVSSLSVVDAPVVVNCTGIGARTLVPDEAVMPVRGQVVVVENPGISEFYIDHGLRGTDYIYAFPHGDVIVLGGTSEKGSFDLTPRPSVSERILRDCAAVYPALRGARVVAERVGLRPYRPEVRLDSEPLGDGRVLWHNYGHGGAGVSLSWGCAREIAGAVSLAR